VRELSSGRIVGSTSYHDIVPAARRVEIGYTWYARSWQRTHVNTACKLLLLRHAFEGWKSIRVTLKTDARNQRSRAAIERIGGQFEGIRRAHVAATDGTVRDSAYFSVLAAEWPAARERLQDLLARPREAGRR
jgi:N-acetyltransferase